MTRFLICLSLFAPLLAAWAGDVAVLRVVEERRFPESWTKPVFTTTNGRTSFTPPTPVFGEARKIGVILRVEVHGIEHTRAVRPTKPVAAAWLRSPLTGQVVQAQPNQLVTVDGQIFRFDSETATQVFLFSPVVRTLRPFPKVAADDARG